ncbi:MAG: hypothetical protein QNJ19_07430 [Woeseiaceae bacterium]|nr:hypothetical protein [Woeseiaceae bacterium]
MNKSWFAASLLSAVAAVIRTIDGHGGPLADARESAMLQSSITFFHVTWYVLSAFFLIAAFVFLRLARGDQDAAAAGQANILAAFFLATAAVLVANAFVFGWFPAVAIASTVTGLVGVLALAGGRGIRP